VFALKVFEELYRDNYRKKSLLVKLYGWDKDFEEVFFLKNREELRSDLTADDLYEKLNFEARTFSTRNQLNKLRLLLNEVESNNQRQQDLQSRFMRLRLGSQLSKVDQQMSEIASNKNRRYLVPYLEEIGNTQQMMMNSKARARNRISDLASLEQDVGAVNLNHYYPKQEHDIDQVEKYLTGLRLQKARG
jgi:hypothetical protein